jgi:hypothetical protein
MLATGKHSSLSQTFLNYSCKEFYSIDTQLDHKCNKWTGDISLIAEQQAHSIIRQYSFKMIFIEKN